MTNITSYGQRIPIAGIGDFATSEWGQQVVIHKQPQKLGFLKESP